MLTRSLVCSLFVFCLSASACSGPCRDLAEQICSCEPNANEEQSCIVNIDALQVDQVAEAELDRCAALLETCQCEALDRGEYGACGLTRSRPQSGG